MKSQARQSLPMIAGNHWFHYGSMILTSALLLGCGSGGGGGGSNVVEIPEAVVKSVANGQVLEGAAGGTTELTFDVTLDKPVERGLDVFFDTVSTAKAGFQKSVGTGAATGEDACSKSGADYVTVINGRTTIKAGSSTGKISVTVCGDATLEPNETLHIVWRSQGAAGATVVGTIVNDDAGGLNGTGATVQLGGLPSFGRDVNPLTNGSADGALGFSFDKQAACTVDKVSGLSWQKLPVPAESKSYSELSAYVTAVNASAPCGFNDWRVPTVNELLTLMDASKMVGSPSNADHLGVAADAMTGKFWTSEPRALASTVDAWQLDADNGGVISYVAQTAKLGIRLVRGVSISAACDNVTARFTDLNDGTVADAKTGLMWKKCAEGYSDTACTAGPALTFNTANTIVSRLGAVNAGTAGVGWGYSDWRVPTRNELASLVNRACTTNPAIVGAVFPNTSQLPYATATLDANDANRVWRIDFSEGDVGQTLLNTDMSLRLVRAGQ